MKYSVQEAGGKNNKNVPNQSKRNGLIFKHKKKEIKRKRGRLDQKKSNNQE